MNYNYGSKESNPYNYDRLLSSEGKTFSVLPHANAVYIIPISADAITLLDTFYFEVTKGAGALAVHVKIGYTADNGLFIPIGFRTITPVAAVNYQVGFCRGVEFSGASGDISLARLGDIIACNVQQLTVFVGNLNPLDTIGPGTGYWRQLRKD